MTARRNTIIAISIIVAFAATVGFFITLDLSPQIAYARLFIDAGLAIGLLAIVLAFYREKEMPTDPLVSTLRELKNGNYKAKVPMEKLEALRDVANAINELAIILAFNQEKQEAIRRDLRAELLPELKQKSPALISEHSLHPELGPVSTITDVDDDVPEINAQPLGGEGAVNNVAKVVADKLDNTLIDSKPPIFDQPAKPTSPIKSERPSQDLADLYQRFIDAQRSLNHSQIDYALFLNTVEKTKEELITAYNCQGVSFDIVQESNRIALQPKIIRQ